MKERNEKKVGYVANGKTEYDGRHGPEIDLGLGTSPIGPAPELRGPLARRDPLQELSKYPDPYHTKTRTQILNSIGLDGELGPENVILDANGSYGAGDEITRYLSQDGYQKIYVSTYSFPNVSQWAIRHGVKYAPITSTSDTVDPDSSLKEILNMDTEDLTKAIVYMDYPNNPTGAANPNTMRAVTNHVSKNGGVVFLDGAFAEVLGEEFKDSFQYVLDRGGIALCSLSKTQGLPNVRSGYAILGKGHCENGYVSDQRLVFGLSGEAEFIYEKLFEPQEDGSTLAQKHTKRVSNYNTMTNLQLYAELEKLGLKILPTDTRTPIQVVVSNKPDFYQRLQKVGIVTESLSDYSVTLNGQVGYGHSAVRMLTPAPRQLEEVVRRTEAALRL